jgi:transcriptional regulator with XRE-family HTH domain
LRWARQAAGREINDVADRFKIAKESVHAWEAGKKSPSWKSLRQLASFYRRPLAALLLAESPKSLDSPTDFRTIPDAQRKLSAKTLLAIRTARWLQARALEMQQELEHESQFDKQSVSLGDDVEATAQKCRAKLGIDLVTQTNWKSSGEAYRHTGRNHCQTSES